MKRRIEPEPALGRVAVAEGAFLHLDIADEEPFLEGLPLKSSPMRVRVGEPAPSQASM
jgi:hypothetical protein